MTLQEKFNATVPIQFGGMYEPLLKDCEKVADDFAIEFAEWVIKYGQFNKSKSTKELLEIYKKESGAIK